MKREVPPRFTAAHIKPGAGSERLGPAMRIFGALAASRRPHALALSAVGRAHPAAPGPGGVRGPHHHYQNHYDHHRPIPQSLRGHPDVVAHCSRSPASAARPERCETTLARCPRADAQRPVTPPARRNTGLARSDQPAAVARRPSSRFRS